MRIISCFRTSFPVLKCPFLFSNILSYFRISFSVLKHQKIVEEIQILDLVTKRHTSKYCRHAPKSHGWPLEKLRTFSKMVLQNKLKFLCNKKFSSASASAGAIIKNWRAVRKCVRNNYKGATVRAPHSKNPRNPTSAYNTHYNY